MNIPKLMDQYSIIHFSDLSTVTTLDLPNFQGWRQLSHSNTAQVLLGNAGE